VQKQLRDPDAVLTVAVGPGPTKVEDNQIYNTAGIEVKPEFPGGMNKFTHMLVKIIVLRGRRFER
jgi:hypothetical protein